MIICEVTTVRGSPIFTRFLYIRDITYEKKKKKILYSIIPFIEGNIAGELQVPIITDLIAVSMAIEHQYHSYKQKLVLRVVTPNSVS